MGICSSAAAAAGKEREFNAVITQAEQATGKDLDGDGKVGAKPTQKEGGNRAVVPDEMADGIDLPVSLCNGNKKSLFVGINYFGSSAELRGCINDVKNIKKFVTETFNFPTDDAHMRTLTDDSKDPGKLPTKRNMEEGFAWLVAGAKSGDSLFFHYSGHGGSQKDRDPDTDEVDGKDETLAPCDYEKAGQIVDDDLHRMLVASLPQGVRLTAVMDCCHSGSVFDLPYTYGVDASHQPVEKDNRKAAMAAAMAAGMAFMSGNQAAAMAKGMEAVKLFTTPGAGGGGGGGGAPGAPGSQSTASAIKIRSSLADVIQFSGCRDEQTSADATIAGAACGAMSWALIKSFQEHGRDQDYISLLGHVRDNLQGKFQQVPQMSTGHRMKLNNLKFIM